MYTLILFLYSAKPKAAKGAFQAPSFSECESTYFGCPGCNTQLPARRWRDPTKPSLSRTEVKTPTGLSNMIIILFYFMPSSMVPWNETCLSSGYVTLMTNNDLALPCVVCLSQKQGHGDDYLSADFSQSMIHTSLEPRLRQHFQRVHGFGVRHPHATNYKSHAKKLLCRRLHAHVLKFDSNSDFLSVSTVPFVKNS